MILNFFTLFVVVAICHHYSRQQLIKNLLYLLELLFVIWLSYDWFQRIKEKKNLMYFFILIVYFVFHVSLNNQSDLKDLIKIYGTIIVYIYVYNFKFNFRNYDQKQIAFIALSPLLVLFIDVIIGFSSGVKNSLSFFYNSNNFIYYTICCAWLLELSGFKRGYIILYLLLSFAVSSTLGAVLAFIIGLSFFLRKKILSIKYVSFMTLFLGSFYTLLMYSDLYLLERIRGTGTLIINLLDDYSISEFSDVSFGEAMSYSNSEDGSNVSFLFRIKIWSECLQVFLSESLVYICLGIGFGTIPMINSFGLVAHNDYLTILIEGGGVGLVILTYGAWSGFLKLKSTIYIIPYLAILIYFFTENLYFNFFGNILFSICLAVSVRQVEKNNKRTIIS